MTRGHNLKLYKPRTSSRVRSSLFTVRAINNWNSLPHTVINAPSANVLKNLLDCTWTTFMNDYQVANNYFCNDQAFKPPLSVKLILVNTNL